MSGTLEGSYCGGDGEIGGQEAGVGQLGEGNPAERLTFHAAWLTGIPPDQEYVELDDPFRVRVLVVHEGGRGLDRDAELFMQFALQRERRGLAGLQLATGEFPETTGMAAGRSPGDEHAVVPIAQDPGSHGDQWRCRLPCRTGQDGLIKAAVALLVFLA